MAVDPKRRGREDRSRNPDRVATERTFAWRCRPRWPRPMVHSVEGIAYDLTERDAIKRASEVAAHA
jgi:hypothetical protein